MNFKPRSGFLVVLALSLVAYAAIPRTKPILHSSPELYEVTAIQVHENAVRFQGTGLIEGQVFVDGGLTVSGTVAQKVVVGHTISDGGTPAMAIESRVITMSGGTATYTFTQAFAHAPVCLCSDTTITTPAACNTNAATASQVVLFGGTSAVLNVICVGAR